MLVHALWSDAAPVIACGPSPTGLNGAARGFLTIAFLAAMGLVLTGRGRALMLLAPVSVAVTALLAAL